MVTYWAGRTGKAGKAGGRASVVAPPFLPFLPLPPLLPSMTPSDRVLSAVDAAADEMVDFTRALVRLPTVNPPGDGYAECAELIGRRLSACGFETQYFPADGRPEHTPRHPRINVVGR